MCTGGGTTSSTEVDDASGGAGSCDSVGADVAGKYPDTGSVSESSEVLELPGGPVLAVMHVELIGSTSDLRKGSLTASASALLRDRLKNHERFAIGDVERGELLCGDDVKGRQGDEADEEVG